MGSIKRNRVKYFLASYYNIWRAYYGIALCGGTFYLYQELLDYLLSHVTYFR